MPISDFGNCVSDLHGGGNSAQTCAVESVDAADPSSAVQSPKPRAWLLLVTLMLFAAAPLCAQTRTPAEAERLYHEVGEQLFCTCGCREKLLSCSHNVCGPKTDQRNYLRELSQMPQHDAEAIKQQMVTRFGPKVLQVPQEDSLFTVVAVGMLALVAGFGGMFWYIVGRNRAKAESDAAAPPQPAAKDAMEERIERDMQDLE